MTSLADSRPQGGKSTLALVKLNNVRLSAFKLKEEPLQRHFLVIKTSQVSASYVKMTFWQNTIKPKCMITRILRTKMECLTGEYTEEFYAYLRHLSLSSEPDQFMFSAPIKLYVSFCSHRYEKKQS